MSAKLTPRQIAARAQELGLSHWSAKLWPEWVHDFKQVCQMDPRGHFVWAWDEASASGMPIALDDEAIEAMRRFGASSAGYIWAFITLV